MPTFEDRLAMIAARPTEPAETARAQRRQRGTAMSQATAGLTLEALRARRDEILRIAAAHGASNVRVFGSVARGEADSRSDVDVLVDVSTDSEGFAYFGRLEDLRRALTNLLGRDVDVIDSAALRQMRERVLHEAVPV
jgi:uncharacterized protein